MNSQSEPKQCGTCVYIVAVLGAFVIVAGLVAIMRHYTKPEPLGQDRAAFRLKTLMELKASNADVLDNPNYAWQDPVKGIVRMPINRAMELALKMWQNPAAARADLTARVEKATAAPKPISFE